ncbi:serine/threonine protein kinase [Streptomyces sparsogenes DSM 40356]|uniref:Serine/threonine protein kinase n=1 Tax=Streptomyces sparsogenes DSM 40356 TaxID=1331668 RepID=A0A1R1SMY8_9ACTN|nr:serine/threonine-protein kinase [Streptomyces sparsogenes]OMI39666.1 serine/threonine protein kinase [Streptomyces sparsogenes DSM 40356]
MGGYRLLFRLGAGGMGRVYLGRSAGGRYVALKMVHPWLASAPGFRERFAREVRASQAVSGRGTVKVVAADVDAPAPWLASAYVPGPALAEVVGEHGPLPEPSLWRLLSGLAEALDSVHGSGLVHRDLKPSNVLVSQDGPLLIDFGIARAADETALTGTGLVVGSAGYMSPEQAEGREVTPAADVFSLGTVLAFAATGRGPFGTGSGPELLYRVVHREPDLEGMPEGPAAIVRDCLSKRPEDRPSVAELYALAAERDADGRDWLPGPVSALIARRAEHLLNLESADVPHPPEPGRAAAGVLPPTRVDSRAGGPGPGAGSGPDAGLGSGPGAGPGVGPGVGSGQGVGPGAGPDVGSGLGAGAGSGPGVGRQGGDDPPSAGARLSSWVRGGGLGNPGPSMLGLVPMLALLLMAPKLRTIVRDYPETPDNIDFGGLSEWAQHNDWFMPAPVLLLIVLAGLQYTGARLQRYREWGVRLWAVAGALYWLAWAGAIGLSTAWFLGMDDGLSGDAASPHTNGAFIAAHICVGLALFGNAIAAPFVGIGAVKRLNRALTEEVTAGHP